MREFAESIFQSTPSAWRETTIPMFFFVPETFQSTPSAWRETEEALARTAGCNISIHSLRMEGDVAEAFLDNSENISIHSLRMEGDNMMTDLFTPSPGFQSTPSAWRETFSSNVISSNPEYFNPLPPHGGRPSCSFFAISFFRISIHSLRMEGDCVLVVIYKLMLHFNPLPPHGGRL